MVQAGRSAVAHEAIASQKGLCQSVVPAKVSAAGIQFALDFAEALALQMDC
jgi:hypothetical protein